MADTSDHVLTVKNLKSVFFTNSGLFRAVDDLSFTVSRGVTLAIVGESGCGKSVTALSLMRLVPDPPGRIVGGSVKLDGQELTTLSDAALAHDIRGRRIAMIMQDPMTSLNPVFSIGDQVGKINAVLRGHYAYYGVAGNLRCLVKVYRAVERYWERMLCSRSWAGRRLTWEKYNQIKARTPLLKPKLRLPYPELQALAVL